MLLASLPTSSLLLFIVSFYLRLSSLLLNLQSSSTDKENVSLLNRVSTMILGSSPSLFSSCSPYDTF